MAVAESTERGAGADIAKRRAARPVKGDARVAKRLRDAVEGDVLFDAFSRGRYATDASFYQIEPLGVVVPKNAADVEAALTIASSW